VPTRLDKIVPDKTGWTVETYAIHNEALRESEEKFQTERDRRYSEVNVEREKALKIKEKADESALMLAREIQVYKDEKANQLREQISSERGQYVTRVEMKPIFDFVAAQGNHWGDIRVLIGILLAAGAFVVAFLNMV